MVAAINQALDEAMARDEKVILLGEDIADPPGGVMKATKGLSTRYGNERVRATPTRSKVSWEPRSVCRWPVIARWRRSC